jgi:two-component system, LytTR family, sensor kinase
MGLEQIFRKRLPLIYTGLWVMVAITHMLILMKIYHIPMVPSFAEGVLFNLSFALIGIGLWYMVRFSDLKQRHWLELVFLHLSVATVVQLLWIVPVYSLLKTIFREDTVYLDFLSGTLTVRVITGIIIYLAIVSIAYLIINLKQLRAQEIRHAELQNLLKETELKMLRFQINPHFLFNSLNSINALIITKPAEAQQMVVKLSEFMRYSLEGGKGAMSELGREIEQCERYLAIEKVRFGERLQVIFEVPEESGSYPVPALILQPLVENAIKHGLYNLEGRVTLKLSVILSKSDGLKISITNQYNPETGSRSRGTGTGLSNVRARLKNLYGREDLFSIIKDQKDFTVIINIPEDGTSDPLPHY